MANQATFRAPGRATRYSSFRFVPGIALQQILGAIAVAPFVAFALSIGPNRWLKPVVAVFVAFELATNAIPLVMVAMSNLSADTAYTLTVVEDFADAGLFVSVAAFAI